MNEAGEFFKTFGQSKLPSLLLLLLIYCAGVFLLINSANNQALLYIGTAVLFLGGILTIISYCDYRNKEHIDGLLGYYRTALDNISRTHTTIEQTSQNTLTRNSSSSTVGAEGEYSPAPISETDTP